MNEYDREKQNGEGQYAFGPGQIKEEAVKAEPPKPQANSQDTTYGAYAAGRQSDSAAAGGYGAATDAKAADAYTARQEPYPQQTGGSGSGSYYGGSYYNGPYYTTQTPGGGFHTGAAGRPTWTAGTTTAVAQPPAKRRGGPSRVLGFVAMLLVAALCGFGGGYLANLNNGGGASTVVYRSADGATAGRTNTVDSLSVSDVAAAASESVVSITTENIVTNPFTGGQVQSGAGSGVIISDNGYIITNNHVISGADNIIVTLPDGTEAGAELVGADPTSDIAVVKIEATGLVPAILGDSSALAVGDMCLAIGNPMGTLGGTVTDGIISAINREITIDDASMNLLQMSAAVSPGNSGGGLFNANAELIGIVNAKSSGESTEGLGFAIPVNTAIEVAQDLIDVGYVTGRPALGVTVEEIASAEQALQRGVTALGVYIVDTTEGGAARLAGLETGDLFVSFNGNDINTTSDLTSAIRGVEVGDEVEIVVNRGGESVTVTATMQERSEA